MVNFQFSYNAHFTVSIEATEQNEEIANAEMFGEHFNPDDSLKESFDGVGADPIEVAGLFEGDIVLSASTDLRNATEPSGRWPGAEIPYVISSSYNIYELSVIARAIKKFHKETCIGFLPRISEGAYIVIMKGTGCYSNVGRTGGRQELSLGTGCVTEGMGGKC